MLNFKEANMENVKSERVPTVRISSLLLLLLLLRMDIIAFRTNPGASQNRWTSIAVQLLFKLLQSYQLGS